MDDSVLKALYEAQKACMKHRSCDTCACDKYDEKKGAHICTAKFNLVPCEFGIVEETKKAYRLEGDETL